MKPKHARPTLTKIVQQLMAARIQPAKNSRDYLQHFGRENISIYEYLRDIRQLFAEDTSNRPEINDAVHALARFSDTSLKIYNADGYFANLISPPTPVDMQPMVYVEIYTDAMIKTQNALPLLRYEHQRDFDANDVCLAEKSLGFEEIKERTRAGIREINDQAVAHFQSLAAAEKQRPKSPPGASPFL